VTGDTKPSGPNWGLLGFITSMAALIVAGAAWQQHQSAIAELRGGQRALVSEVASLRQAPVIDLAGVPALGADDAVVTLVEFSDYECPFCLRHFEQTMPQIEANYIGTGKIRYAFRDWPVDQLHPMAIRGHEAAHCAGEQQKYWEMHRRLFGSPAAHAPEAIRQLAVDLGLDLGAFTACVDSGRPNDAIRATGRQAQELGATGTPAFFIGVRDRTTNQVTVLAALSGAQPYEVFARVLDDVLNKTR
jgi:protein-disulfide isomerase